MNYLLKLTICLSILTSACKKDKKEDPVKTNPTVEVNFGYHTGFFNFMIYANQNEITVDSITSHDYFGISIAETNLAANHGFTTDSGVIEFNLITDNDQEHFHNFKNVTGKSTAVFEIFGIYSFESDLSVPYKISAAAIKGNDTLEIKSTGDIIRLQYQSQYSGLIARDSIKINP